MIGIPEGEDKEKGIESVSEQSVTEDTPNTKKEPISRYEQHRGPHTRGCKQTSTKT